MASADGGAYSYSLTVFSPSGKLVQIEHALAAVSQGTTSLGIKGTRFPSVAYDRLIVLYSVQWNCHSYREEVLLDPDRRLHDRESGCNLSQYWSRVFRHGS